MFFSADEEVAMKNDIRSVDKLPPIKVKQTTSVKSSDYYVLGTPFYLQKLRFSVTAVKLSLCPCQKQELYILAGLCRSWTRNDLSKSLNIRKWYFHVILCRHLSKHPLSRSITLLLFIIIIPITSRKRVTEVSMIQFRVEGTTVSRPEK